jgi:regulator of sigma E protease
MTDTLRMILAGGIVLGIMVLLHEWGHFIVAKLCGVRVDVFSVGFGPRIWGVKRGDTDYRLSILPLGGYVRMAGDNPIEERTGADYEFLSRPRWQRCLIALAGPAVNVIVTFAIFWGIFLFVGAPIESFLRVPADVAAVPQSLSTASGVQPGDRIVAVNSIPTPSWRQVYTEVAVVKPGEPLSLTVQRGSSQQIIEGKAPDKTKSADALLGYPALPAVAEEIEIGFPAEKAGMKAGDEIISINGQKVVSWGQFVDQVRNFDGRSIHFIVRRDGSEIPMDISPIHMMGPDGEMVWAVGVEEKAAEVYEPQSFAESVKDAAFATVSATKQIGQVLGGLFSGKVSVRDLRGPVGIVRESGRAAKRGPVRLLELTAIISLNLGLLNLLPIPILDGGHLLMLAIEGLLRRDLSITFKERFVQVGLVFLLGLSAVVMYSDILRAIQGHH